MNAIELLKQQHKKTLATLEEASEGKLGDAAAKAAADELVAHMVIEEHIFYPRVRQYMKDMIGESFEEHTVARFELARCLTTTGTDEKKARFTVLKELIEHHVQEEEKELFPKVKREMSSEELEQLGTRMEAMFEKAVEAGLDALVRGPTRELDAPKARKRPSAASRSMAPSRHAR